MNAVKKRGGSLPGIAVRSNQTGFPFTARCNSVTARLLLIIFFALSSPANSAEIELSSNPEIRKLEERSRERAAKAKPEAQADIYYDLGKSCFENRDSERAEYYIGRALSIEETLNRPGDCVRTRVALSMVLVAEGKIAEAFAQYKKALELAVSAKLSDEEVTIIDSMGSLAYKVGRLADATEYFDRALRLAEKNKNISAQINAMINLANVLRKRNKPEQALELLSRATSLASESEEGRSVALAYKQLAGVQYDLGRLQDSVDSYRKSIEIFRKDFDEASLADSSRGLAEAYYDLQRPKEACACYKEALEAIKNEPDDRLKLKVLTGLGCAESDLGNFEAAGQNHQQALEIARKLKDRAQELAVILQIGNDLLQSGYPEAALYKLLDAEKLAEGSGFDAQRKANLLVAIGKCYKSLGQTDTAFKYYSEALSLYRDIEAPQDEGLVLVSLSVLALDNENIPDFEKYNRAAREIFADSQDKRNLAILDYNYAQYLYTRKKFEEAAALYESAYDAIKTSGDCISESMILRGMGLAQFAAGNPQKALNYYEKALLLAEQSGVIEALWDAHLGLGRCHKRLGADDKAVLHLTKAVDLVEQERGHLTRDSFKTFNLDLRNDCFMQLVDLYISMNRPYEALLTAEKGKARAFLDMLSSRKTGHAVETFEKPISSRFVPEDNSRSVAPALAKFEPGTRGVSVIPRASQVYASSAVSPANAAAPDIAEIKALVSKSKSTVLEYYILPDKIAVWVIEPDAAIHMLPPIKISKQTLNERVSLTYESVIHQPRDQSEIAALSRRRQDMLRELYDLLLKPAEAYLPQDQESLVTIVPHGSIFMVPFAALISDDGKFLVEKHTLAFTPAIGVMRATQKLQDSVAGLPDRLLAFGNPITSTISFIGKLPFAEKEVRNIAALFGAENATVKIGQDADKRTFEELAPQYSDIHLATHGLVDEEQPMQSSLILAPTKFDDGLLTVKDILAMKELKAKLVVLSACQTGRGKITGDGIIGLSRAFIIAGTPSVLVSQWNVDDIITEYQMKSFYKGYLAHAGKARALRLAQLDTIKLMEGSDYGKGKEGSRANPRYWAAFQLVGDCR